MDGGGGLCPRGRSAPQGLYDPDRARTAEAHETHGTNRGFGPSEGPANPFESVFWSRALAEVTGALKNAKRFLLVSDVQTGAEVAGRAGSPLGPMNPVETPAPEAVQLWLWPSVNLFDGRLADRGWLQEVRSA